MKETAAHQPRKRSPDQGHWSKHCARSYIPVMTKKRTCYSFHDVSMCECFGGRSFAFNGFKTKDQIFIRDIHGHLLQMLECKLKETHLYATSPRYLKFRDMDGSLSILKLQLHYLIIFVGGTLARSREARRSKHCPCGSEIVSLDEAILGHLEAFNRP
jgi:hypothetical protein